MDCGNFRFIFAYTRGVRITGYERVPDWPNLGPSVLIATALIVAVRTAKWPAKPEVDPKFSDVDPELDKEIRFAMRVSARVMRALVSRHECLFPQKRVPTWDPAADEVMK